MQSISYINVLTNPSDVHNVDIPVQILNPPDVHNIDIPIQIMNLASVHIHTVRENLQTLHTKYLYKLIYNNKQVTKYADGTCTFQIYHIVRNLSYMYVFLIFSPRLTFYTINKINHTNVIITAHDSNSFYNKQCFIKNNVLFF